MIALIRDNCLSFTFRIVALCGMGLYTDLN